MKYATKENLVRQRNCLLNIISYKLRAGKHFGYYIIGMRNKGYRVGSTEEIFNQVLIIPRVHCG